MRLFNRSIHKIWLIPLDTTVTAGTVAASILTGDSIIDYLNSPLIHVRTVTGMLGARNRDLNPVGLKRNLRQNFGSNSNKITIDGYISPLVKNRTYTNPVEAIANSSVVKYAILKDAVLNQTRFLLLHNNDFEIITLDSMTYTERDTKTMIYDVTIQATSIRDYSGYGDFLRELAFDGILNTISQNLLNRIVF